MASNMLLRMAHFMQHIMTIKCKTVMLHASYMLVFVPTYDSTLRTVLAGEPLGVVRASEETPHREPSGELELSENALLWRFVYTVEPLY